MLLLALLAPVTAAAGGGNGELWRQWLRGPPSEDIPLSDARMAAKAGPEQVHITGGSPDSAIVTYTTNTSEPTAVSFRPAGTAEDWSTAEGPPGQVYSMVLDPRFPATELPPGVAASSGGCQGGVNYTNPACFYTSPEIHSVTLSDLKPNTRYEYTCGTSDKSFSFKTPPAVGATQSIKLAVVGDLGQTHNSSATIDLMEAALTAGDVDLVLHAGDLSYADGNGYRWDAYGRLGESESQQSACCIFVASLTPRLKCGRVLGRCSDCPCWWQPRDREWRRELDGLQSALPE
jgi:hypothetical protein